MSGFTAIVLAGERPGGGVLARELGIAAGVLAPVAGRPAVVRVLDALRASSQVRQIVLCGPSREALAASPQLQDLLADGDLIWRAPAAGPAASARAALATLDRWPALITSGDHALLDPGIIDDFCTRAMAADGDAVAGLVPWPAVHSAFPESRRTLLKFSDQVYCGSNLFAILRPAGMRAVEFWQQVETLRKRPWRIARKLGLSLLLRYLAGRLSLARAAAVMSARSGCRVVCVEVAAARAAVDVDSLADLRLAEDLLTAASDSPKGLS